MFGRVTASRDTVTPGGASSGALPTAVQVSRLQGFEGLRAIAALSVFAFHLLPRTGLPWKHWVLRQLTTDLNTGVVVFFVISGFLLYLPFSRALAGLTRRVELRGYFVRRAVRIYPAYWLALAATMLVIKPNVPFSDFGDAMRNVLLVQTYSRHGTSGLGVSWSLVVELSFYLFLPLFAAVASMLAGRFGRALGEWAAVAAIAAVGLVARAYAYWGHPPRWVVVLPAYLFYFAIGFALAVGRVGLERGGAGAQRWQRVVTRVGLWWSLAIALYVGVAVMPGRFIVSGNPTAGTKYVVFLLHGIVALFAILPFTAIGPGEHPIRRLVTSRPMELLGLVSYGIYLWHLPLVNRVADDLGKGSNPVPLEVDTVVPYALLGATILVAWLSYRWLETPLIRWSHRVTSPPDRL